MRCLNGKVALIIGAATGIGRAVCAQMADAGALVMAADIGHPTLRIDLVEAIRRSGDSAAHTEVDVRSESAVIAAIEHTIATFGGLDILVNNAGIGSLEAPIDRMDWADWHEVLSVNLTGIAYGMKHAVPIMRARRWGRIINTASQLAHKPAPGYAAYCVSKAGVVALTASVAQEVAADGITVNCVCPGPTDTPMWHSADPDWSAEKLRQIPIRRVGTPSEVASAYVYLASQEAAYMVGQSISPNGGDVMW